MALDEEAGRSQVNSLPVFSDKVFLQPGRQFRHASFALSRSDSFVQCRLGILGSAGAALCLQTCEIAATVQILAFLFPGFGGVVC